jgi:protein phosphatase
MSLPLYIHGRSDVGRQRSQNEDSFRIAAQPDGSQLLVVCDGMGGHEAGEVASQVASDRLVEVITSSAKDQPPRTLFQAFVAANRAVLDASHTRGVEGMGTTGVVAWVIDGRCYVGWVGDSRLYHFRGGAQLDRSRDHTRVEHMVRNGILKPEQARNHPDAHVLVQALGGSAGVQKTFKPEVWMEPLELRHGDVVLLCSDGLYDFIEDDELYPLIERRDYQDAVERLIHTANERGGADNITVILLVVGQPEIPAMGSASAAAPRRETLPEGMAVLPVATRASSTSGRRETLRAEVSSPRASSAASSLSSEGPRRVPLWWVPLVAVLSLGTGLALGWLTWGSGGVPAPSPSTRRVPDAGTGSALVQVPPASQAEPPPSPVVTSGADGGASQAEPPEVTGTRSEVEGK